MTEQEQAEVMAIEAEIKNLDAEFESWQENRGDVSGSQKDVFQYRQKRQELLQRKAEIEGVGDGVKAYLESKKNKSQLEISKLDNAKVDNSLNPLGGKSL